MSARDGVAFGALTLIGLLFTGCAANPELRRARDVGAEQLKCEAGAAEVRLEKDEGTRRVYDVECDMTVVRVDCSTGESCEPERERRPRPPFMDQML